MLIVYVKIYELSADEKGFLFCNAKIEPLPFSQFSSALNPRINKAHL